MNYQEADALLREAEHKGRWPYVKLAHNTKLFRADPMTVVVKFWETHILTFLYTGTVHINLGGWYTSTTQQRLNDFMPEGFSIWKNKGLWYLRTPKETGVLTGKEPAIVLGDGKIFAGVSNEIPLRLALIEKYVDRYQRALFNGKINKADVCGLDKQEELLELMKARRYPANLAYAAMRHGGLLLTQHVDTIDAFWKHEYDRRVPPKGKATDEEFCAWLEERIKHPPRKEPEAGARGFARQEFRSALKDYLRGRLEVVPPVQRRRPGTRMR